jgi:hypothetical protein
MGIDASVRDDVLIPELRTHEIFRNLQRYGAHENPKAKESAMTVDLNTYFYWLNNCKTYKHVYNLIAGQVDAFATLTHPSKIILLTDICYNPCEARRFTSKERDKKNHETFDLPCPPLDENVENISFPYPGCVLPVATVLKNLEWRRKFFFPILRTLFHIYYKRIKMRYNPWEEYEEPKPGEKRKLEDEEELIEIYTHGFDDDDSIFYANHKTRKIECVGGPLNPHKRITEADFKGTAWVFLLLQQGYDVKMLTGDGDGFAYFLINIDYMRVNQPFDFEALMDDRRLDWCYYRKNETGIVDIPRMYTHLTKPFIKHAAFPGVIVALMIMLRGNDYVPKCNIKYIEMKNELEILVKTTKKPTEWVWWNDEKKEFSLNIEFWKAQINSHFNQGKNELVDRDVALANCTWCLQYVLKAGRNEEGLESAMTPEYGYYKEGEDILRLQHMQK